MMLRDGAFPGYLHLYCLRDVHVNRLLIQSRHILYWFCYMSKLLWRCGIVDSSSFEVKQRMALLVPG